MILFTACIDVIRRSILHAPFVYIFVCSAFGFILQHSLEIYFSDSEVVVLLLISAVLCAGILYIFIIRVRVVSVLLWFFLFGFIYPSLHYQEYSPLVGEQHCVARLISHAVEKEKTYACEIETLSVRDTHCVSKTLVYIHKDSCAAELMYGDVIELQGAFRVITNFADSQFDYAVWMAEQGIYSSAYIPRNSWKRVQKSQSLRVYAMALRQDALNYLQTKISSKEHVAVIAALVFGDKSFVSSETKSHFATAGAMHVMAVSGLHVGIIASIIVLITSFFPHNNFSMWLKMILVLGTIWLYAAITGLSPSVQRAAIMFSLFSIGIIMRRRSNSWNTLAAAAFISFVMNPQVLFLAGFQLSYVAVMSIMYGAPKLLHIYRPRSKVLQYVWGIIAVSIVVQIGTFPISVYYFQTIPLYSILTNICVIPLAFVIISTVFASFIPYVSLIAVELVSVSLDFFIEWITRVSKFPHAVLTVSLNHMQVFQIYTLIILCVIITEYFHILRIQKYRL
ncbi:MAG: ComEC/Rec2 family competence protein [Bacteroidota bacterium]